MSSSGKKKTTMAKLMRESKLRERRAEKQIRRDARKLAAASRSDQLDAPGTAAEALGATADGHGTPPQIAVEPVAVAPLADA
jgi:hypothetical protein